MMANRTLLPLGRDFQNTDDRGADSAQVPEAAARARTIDLTIDGVKVSAPEGATLLEVIRSMGKDVPTLCFLETLTPVGVCRVCVVEVEGARTLVPSCSRKAEPGMAVKTDSERVRLSRRLVLELLASAADVSTAPELKSYMEEYGARPERFGPPASPLPIEERDCTPAGRHVPGDGAVAANLAQPVRIDNELYVRDYSKCILCYKCVQACGSDAQNTFAIVVAGRGFDAHIATEFSVPLPDSACVYCGNCIGVCPTGALMFRTEYEMRQAGVWDEARQQRVDTICGYCGVGCTLTLHVQDNTIVKVTSPADNSTTNGHLCIKGRFGWQYVRPVEPEE
jgi:predicted molibdopterin-dependent oxidoreductase YjgC